MVDNGIWNKAREKIVEQEKRGEYLRDCKAASICPECGSSIKCKTDIFTGYSLVMVTREYSCTKCKYTRTETD